MWLGGRAINNYSIALYACIKINYFRKGYKGSIVQVMSVRLDKQRALIVRSIIKKKTKQISFQSILLNKSFNMKNVFYSKKKLRVNVAFTYKI